MLELGAVELTPPEPLTDTGTLAEPLVKGGETAVIEVAELTAKLAALLEPNLTAFTSTKFAPTTSTEVPPAFGAFLGSNRYT
jgi:hypothetical protein